MSADRDAEPTGSDDEAEIARLGALPVLDYERQREAAAERLGCRVAILDREVEAARGSASAASNGTTNTGGAGHTLASTIPELEPWPEPIEGTALLDEMAATILRYVVLDVAATDAMALWIVHTHAIDAAYVSPRLAITSPEKRCGKTTLLTLLRALVARPLATANMTPATLFRSVEAILPTLLIDEADTFLDDAGAMRGIINAGHCRATATVLRNVDNNGWEPRQFDVWCALALAAIGKLPDTIEDRSIKIAMRRRRRDEPVERLRIDRLDRFTPLARQAMRWVDDHEMTLHAADPDVPAELHDRAADNWRPLLAIADAAGGGWPERARHAALTLSRDGAADADGSGITMLSDMRELFAAEPRGVLFTTEIVDALCRREDRPWAVFHHDRPITPHGLAALLRPFGVPTNQTVRRGAKTLKGYRAKDFADAWARYLPPLTPLTPCEAVTPLHAAVSADFSGDRSVTSHGNGSSNGAVTPDVTDGGAVTPERDVTEKSEDFRGLSPCDRSIEEGTPNE